jgi:hypothetical protein
MKTLKFGKKIHDDDAKLKNGLKHHGWVMWHGWQSHGGTWKMGGWGKNIAPETVHVSMRYVLKAWVVRALKCASGHPLKLDMFQQVVSFEVVLKCAVFDR